VTTVELVRHAKAQRRDRWWGRPDRERPLTTAGVDQARALARELTAAGPIAALYSSPWARCTTTLDPLAASSGLPVREEDGLGEALTLPVADAGDAWVASAWLGGRAVAFLNRVVREHPDERVVACSHGDVIPAVMALLVGRDGLDLSDVRCPKGGRFTLVFDGLRCVDVAPSPPPAI
jgi:broad specificity phosphatase PhoE